MNEAPVPVSLEKAIGFALDEARMVLPGIQALFGFQLIAVFNQRFEEVLSPLNRGMHLAALVLIALSCGLVMAPAAYHRQAERGQVSPRLLKIASAFVGAAMIPLMLALSIDVYLITEVVLHNKAASLIAGGACVAVLLVLWIIFPRLTNKAPKSKNSA